jgi:glycine/serine hydroxymethyltransferase
MLVDLRPKNATGKLPKRALDRAFITCNKNGIPFDREKPFVTSGVRLGTPAGTTRGFGEAEFREIGKLIAEVLDGLRPQRRGRRRTGRGARPRRRRKGRGTVRPLPDLSGALTLALSVLRP